MIGTPIKDFLKKYAEEQNVRMHMPGHKGRSDCSPASREDITEITGADSLFEADGIIRESERIASEVFGSHTLYSTEGSSLCIRAMLYLVSIYAQKEGKAPLIAAARNAHRSFVNAAAMLDLEVDFVLPDDPSYLSVRLSAENIKNYLDKAKRLPVAIYLTSPDYLGFISDIGGIARECKRRGVLLLVDNAHGAYLKFLTPSRHPIDLGADLVCDSAHKTLDALTGCAYLHISDTAPQVFRENAKDAMSLFGSTSPSYLLLSSLDVLNLSLGGGFVALLSDFISKLDSLKAELSLHGYTLCGDEPMKLTISAKKYGYTGNELSALLLARGIYSEFADPDYLVLMPSPKNTDAELLALKFALLSIEKKNEITSMPPSPTQPTAALTMREAVLSPALTVATVDSLGKICATVTASCPPAVPIVLPGERITEDGIAALLYYGIKNIKVI